MVKVSTQHQPLTTTSILYFLLWHLSGCCKNDLHSNLQVQSCLSLALLAFLIQLCCDVFINCKAGRRWCEGVIGNRGMQAVSRQCHWYPSDSCCHVRHSVSLIRAECDHILADQPTSNIANIIIDKGLLICKLVVWNKSLVAWETSHFSLFSHLQSTIDTWSGSIYLAFIQKSFPFLLK